MSGERNTRSGKAWRWPLSPETVRAVLSGHGALGIAFAGVIYLVCLTGALTVFTPDLQHWEVPHAPVVTTLSDAAAGRALTQAAQAAPPGATLSLTYPTPAKAGAVLLAYRGNRADQTWAVASDGALVPLDARWSDFLLHLHVNLHLPRAWGGFLVGLTGVALLSSLVSGVLAHPRVVRDAFHLRLGGSRRLAQADWHNRLGVWALPFHATLALTGALLGLSTLIVAALALLLYRGDRQQVYRLFIDPPPPADARAVAMPDLAMLLTRAHAAMPGASPQSVVIERPGRADMRVSVHGIRPRNLVPQDEVQFDAGGRIVAQERPQDLSTGIKVLGGIGQVHFGWFGGAAVRVVYGLLGLALCVVTSSGITIWLARRRDRGRAAPGWERIWAAIAWGQPLALALTAAIALARPDAPLVKAWLGLTLGLVAVAGVLPLPGPSLGRALRQAMGAVLVTLGCAHAMLGPITTVDAVVVIGGAAALLWGRPLPKI